MWLSKGEEHEEGKKELISIFNYLSLKIIKIITLKIFIEPNQTTS
jgi:hypothetical protein